MRIDGILFDKDGTLIDYYKSWGVATAPVVDKLLEYYNIDKTDENREKLVDGIDPYGGLAYKTFSMVVQDLIPIISELNHEIIISERHLAQKLKSFYQKEILRLGENIPCIADLAKIMEEFSKRNKKIGIATTDTYEATKQTMKILCAEKYISNYFTDEMPIDMPVKPDGKLLDIVAKNWNTKPENIVVVGDTVNDMKFAHNGNAIAVGVLSGVGTEKDLEVCADYIIPSIKELSDLIDQIEKEN